MDKKVTGVAFENANFMNGNESAGTRYTVDIQDMSISINPTFYTGNAFDTAISGRLRQNFRGLRVSIEISYQRSLQSNRIRSLINDLIRAFVTNNADSVTFFPDRSRTDSFEVILDASSYNQQYNNTINGFAPSLSLISLDEIATIPFYLEAP